MKLTELIKFFNLLKDEKLKEFLAKRNELEAELARDFLPKGPTSTSSSASTTLSTSSVSSSAVDLKNVLPPKIARIFKKYQKSYDILQNACDEMEIRIKEAQKAGKEEVDYSYTPSFIKAYSFLPIYYDNLLMEKEIAIRDAEYPNQVCINEERQRFVFGDGDFSPTFIQPFINEIQELMDIFNGKFNLENINKALERDTQDTLTKAGINKGFYKDGYNCFFENQTEFYFSRTVQSTIVEKKVDDFVGEYIKVAKLPENIAPNLKGLLTTLTYQSGLSNLMAKMGSSFSSFSSSAGNVYTFSGSDVHFSVSFDKDFKLKITVFSAEKEQGALTEAIVFDFPVVRKATLTVNVKVDKNNLPSFTVDDFKFSSGISMAESAKPDYKLTFLKEAFKDPQKLPSGHEDLLRGFTEYLAKFAGYGSLADMYFRLDKTRTMEAAKRDVKMLAHFHPNLFDDLKERLSEKEINLLKKVYKRFYENKVSKEKISETICKFISKRLGKISDDDKLRYVYLLKMAIDLGSSQSKAVKNTSIDLMNSLKNNKEHLLFAMKSDMAILEAYKEKIHGAFNRLPIFSKDEHLVMMFSLEKQHLAIIIKNPEILNVQDHRYVEFIAGLNPKSKTEFLFEYMLRHGQNQKYVGYLNSSCFPTEKEQQDLLPDMHAAIGKFVMESNLEKFNVIKGHLAVLLDEYVVAWPCTLKSIRERVTMLASDKQVFEKLGDSFLLGIFKDLTAYVEGKNKLHSLFAIQEIVATLQEVFVKIPNRENILLWDTPLEGIQKLIAGKLQAIENVKAKQHESEKEKTGSKEEVLVEKFTKTSQEMGQVITTLDSRSDTAEKRKPEVVSPPGVVPAVFASPVKEVGKEKEPQPGVSSSPEHKH